ncbi:MAG: hypothetical protein WAU68_03460 [Vitreimonas sp.]
MRVLIGAAAALLFAASAAAQPTPPTPPAAPASACGDIPAAPTQPDPAHTTAAQMNRANQAFGTWSADAHAKLQCRLNEAQALSAQARAVEATYNAQAASYTSTVNAWNAATAAYNSHGASSSGTTDRRHSTLGQHGPN